MKKLAVLIVLCTCVSFCVNKDTKLATEGRSVEPRLSGASIWQSCRKTIRAGHVVVEAQCGAVSLPASKEPCAEIITIHAQALRLLSTRPQCTDSAIATLERLARADASAMSDVAAAYYVRAQREDRPADLLSALEASEQAVAAAPQSSAARFNRALIQETLGFNDEAIASWDAFLAIDSSHWADEARDHRNRLARQQALVGATRWMRNREQLSAALQAHDRTAVARLIAPFPSAALRYFEEELLPQWASNPSPERLAGVHTLADALSLRTAGDPFATDIADAMTQASSSPAKITALKQGYLAFQEGRMSEQSFATQKAAESYKKAARLLAVAGSPFTLRAELGYAVAVSFEPNNRAHASALLDPIEQQARTRGYRHLLARFRSTRAYFLGYRGRYVESLEEYDAALAEYKRLRDSENITAIDTRRIGVLRTAGHSELAWREAFRALREASSLVEPQARHVLLGETAAAALALEHPRPALGYQNAAVRLFQKELAAAPPEGIDRIRGIQKNLSVALRARAGIELHLERYDRATRDLNESIRLANAGNETDTNIRRVLQARAEEVRGQALLSTSPVASVAAFTRALPLIATEFRTYRAALFAQRAEAHRRAGHRAEGEGDLRAAIAELQQEETRILEHRRRGSGEELWSSYFLRFQETYRLLIRQLAEERRPVEAFAYAERARAFEPLNLVMQLDVVPEAFRVPATNGATNEVARIQASLPRGTFVIEYCVLDDRTYAWIISRDRFELLKLPVPRAAIARWTAALQQAARQRSESNFDEGLFAPFEALIAAPLSAIRTMPDGGKGARLIFVPDGPMHGLPLAALRNSTTRRYLIQDAPIAFAGSASLYLFSLLRDRLFVGGDSSALVVGDPAFDSELLLAQGMQRLPRAYREAERIHQLYPAGSDVLLSAAATVPEFLERARNHEIVHVAAHAIVNARVPSRSLLLLAPSPDHSGAIDAEELLTRLKLDQTRLVVLSACSSAGGLPVGPEGVGPLVRPLLGAGVPAVIGSLWDVEDATAEELLVSFHRHYRQGSDAAVAMQAAQLDLLRNKNPGLRSVLAWAPFQVIGHASSPFAVQANSNGGTPLGLHSSNSLHGPDRIRSQ